jgi:hypothetical protein
MTKSALVLSIAAMVGIPMAANASLLTGTITLSGGANVTTGSIVFVAPFTVDFSGTTGGFTPLDGDSFSIMNITNPPDAVGTVNIPDFIQFSAPDPNISFSLNFLTPGSDGVVGCSATPPAVNQVCTPINSPFNLSNFNAGTATNPIIESTGGFTVEGIETDSLTGMTTSIVGVFSTSFTVPYQTVLANIAAGGTQGTSFTAQFTALAPTGTPEPSAWPDFMMGFGMVALGAIYRKKLRKA